ncbi:methyl-accepting chemotaxis protein [Oceanospirillum sanctuarii]|uniref:methyl-accepting chemotaxis protein n=1 Tax=Oceanospirillum sanctuarii TaxID=1434821 RepID=UPI000A391E54|nr:methyl-accepting chemotaxis protein [Oceanospirillum sanctuarii]
MTGSLRSIKVTTRIMSLATFLVLVKLSVLLLILFQLNKIAHFSKNQQEQVSEQNRWIEQEAELIDLQAETQLQLQQAQSIQKTYSDMLFWYFDGSLTQYYNSLNKAAESADALENKLANLAMDPDAGELIRPMLSNLSGYREYMESANQFYLQGKSNLAASEISEAHLIVEAMNQQLMELTGLFQKRLKASNQQVQHAVEQTLNASARVAAYSSQSSQSIDSIFRSTLLILLFTVPLSILVAVAVIRSITRPLNQLQHELTTIGQESDLTRSLTLEGRDEIRSMAEATQQLLTQFKTTVDDVDYLANELKATARKGLETSQTTHQQSDEQKQLSETLASTATELGASADSILLTTDQGLERVDQLANRAVSGQQDVQQTAKTISELSDGFSDVEQSVQSLIQHSTSIQSVLEVIQGIAEQTNLLALNAAIEAARAGEQGRGFAVVADEVRSLAQRTSDSTDEIQQMVNNLQRHSQDAIRSLEQNRDQVNAGVALSKTAEDSIQIITDELHQLTRVNQSIAEISREQQQAVTSVDQGVQDILQRAHAVTEKASASRAVNQHLDQMAEKLQQQISHYQH